MARLVLSLVLVLSALLIQASLGAAQDQGISVGFAAPELESRPPNGIAAVIVGGVLMGGSAESFTLMSFCDGGDILFHSRHNCLMAEGLAGSISLTVGITALTVGMIRRKKYKAWRAARALQSLRIAPIVAGGGMSWSTRF